MKRLLALLMALTIVLGLCACTKPPVEERVDPQDTLAADFPVEATEAPVTMPVEEPTEEPTQAPTEPAPEEAPMVSDKEAKAIVKKIQSASKMTLDKAYELAFSCSSNYDKHLKLQKELAALKDCQGVFYQNGKYKAVVEFYLKSGKYYFSIDYAGYSGSIKDGKVTKKTDGDFQFKAESTGSHTNIFTGEKMKMKFKLKFGKDRMFVTWGSSAYYLERE